MNTAAIELGVISNKVSQRAVTRDLDDTGATPTSIPGPKRDLGRATTSHEEQTALASVHRRKSLVHFVALCWCLCVNGWNDGIRCSQGYRRSIT